MPVLEAADLYGLPLEDFVSERDRLARRLREEGRREEAAEVARMRKPTTDAWALDQVARRQPKLMEWLLKAHRTMREAEDSATLREAASSRLQLLDEIVDAAVSALERAGHSSSDAVRDRIARSLLAAAADPAAEQALREGTLVRPVEISGAWPETALEPAPPPPTPQNEEDAAWREQVRRMERRAAELSRAADDLERVAREAGRALDEARRVAEEANRSARSARETARAAQEEADSLRNRGPDGG